MQLISSTLTVFGDRYYYSKGVSECDVPHADFHSKNFSSVYSVPSWLSEQAKTMFVAALVVIIFS